MDIVHRSCFICYFFLQVLLFMCMCLCECVCICVCDVCMYMWMWRAASPTMWVSRIELRWSGLAVGISTHWAILPALWSFFFFFETNQSWVWFLVPVIPAPRKLSPAWAPYQGYTVRLVSDSPQCVSVVRGMCCVPPCCFLLKDSSSLEAGWSQAWARKYTRCLYNNACQQGNRQDC